MDADPWFTDRGADNAADPFNDVRRVVLQSGQYLKVVNTGRTWHSFTNAEYGKDSGFIGYAGNYQKKKGDLDQKVKAGMGFYLADQTTGLASGCNKYICKIHPYMTVEVCTAGNTPKGPNDAFGLTRAHKHPLGLPSVPGIGDEVWVSAQSQEEVGEKTNNIKNKSVQDFDGAYQVINTTSWNVTRIPNVGNNPHNAWPGHTATRDVVISTNWHDNRLSLMDANTKTLISQFRSGATNAHVMAVPGAANRDIWFVKSARTCLNRGTIRMLASCGVRQDRTACGCATIRIISSLRIRSITRPPCMILTMETSRQQPPVGRPPWRQASRTASGLADAQKASRRMPGRPIFLSTISSPRWALRISTAIRRGLWRLPMVFIRTPPAILRSE
jgi:hypothetical protein